jgi:hypothetical protein
VTFLQRHAASQHFATLAGQKSLKIGMLMRHALQHEESTDGSFEANATPVLRRRNGARQSMLHCGGGV